ncbi:hypothetical protein FisN_11Hh290 [Fistulifera solaris]|jgi:hypothetical protein|uniref:Uncharacterized protein n=1 Tax=Fistulifera solaris TaxID=1519565 RepID=A0A1Z5JLG1_FISSO|nr:hypothetical protein FisN_11Hh290 [Fistulifera solaris]|eukprot:GAX14746.1 hypothetical protein FisN_11Hh290 [Fistulifera solaris]
MVEVTKENNVKSMRRFWGGLRQGKSQESVGTDTTTSGTSTPANEDDNIPLIERIKMDMAASSSSLGKRSTTKGASETVEESVSEQSSTSWMNEESHSVLSLVGPRSITRAPSTRKVEPSEDAEAAPRVNTSLKKKLIKVKRTPGSAASVDGSVDISVLSAMKSAGKTKFTAKELKEMGVDIPAQRGRAVAKVKESDKSVRRSRSKSRARDGDDSSKHSSSRGRDKLRSKSSGRARSRVRARSSTSVCGNYEEEATQVVPIEIRPKSPSKEKLSVKERAKNFEQKSEAAKVKDGSASRLPSVPGATLHDSASRGKDSTEKTRSRSVHRRSIEVEDRESESLEKSSRGRDATEKTTRRSKSVHRRSTEEEEQDAGEKTARRSRSVHRRSIDLDDRDGESRGKDSAEKSPRRSKSVHRRIIDLDDRDSESPAKSSRGRDVTEKTTRRSRSVHRRNVEDDPETEAGEKTVRRSRSVHRRSIDVEDVDGESPGKSSRGRDAAVKSPRSRSKSVRRRSIDANEGVESPVKSSRGRDATEKSPRRSKSVRRRSIDHDDRITDSPGKSSRSKNVTEKSPRRSKSVHRRSIGQGESSAEGTRRKSLASEKSPRQRSIGTDEEGRSPRRSVTSSGKSPHRRSKSIGRKVEPKPKSQDYEDYSSSEESMPPVPTQILIRPDQEDETDEEKEVPQQVKKNSDEIYSKIKHAGITQEQFLALTQAGLTITNEE